MDEIAVSEPILQVQEHSAHTLPGLPMLTIGLTVLRGAIRLSVAGRAALCSLDQQSGAVPATGQRFVAGAADMVKGAPARLAEHGAVAPDEERKAAKVSKLLVVPYYDHATQPVINAGSLYQCRGSA